MIILDQIKENAFVKQWIAKADSNMEISGYTEHGFRHADLSSHIARNILKMLNFASKDQERAAIAGYLHDIGLALGRKDHSLSGAVLTSLALKDLNADPETLVEIASAIGSHDKVFEEEDGIYSVVHAAVILADKSDVHRSRVREENMSLILKDIHDRVNYSVTKSFLEVKPKEKLIILELKIDTKITPVMEYFEIFTERMVLCRKAAERLNTKFGLVINDNKLL